MRNTNGSVRFVAMGLALFLHCATVPSSSGAVAQCKNRARPIATKRTLPFVAMGLALFLHCATVPSSSGAESKFKIITSTTDLAALAQEIGGDKVEVESVARGYQDPHFVEAKPSFLLKLRKADLLIVVGLELEIGWLPPLITQSTNPKIQVGAPGYFDASRFAKILEIPTGEA